ncbi:MAG TPA: hypothetical protein VNZ94_12215 [Xanthobacteraceae bacterium]|nr:hypothetical protein [Xanthobacteraceae bacterium]
MAHVSDRKELRQTCAPRTRIHRRDILNVLRENDQTSIRAMVIGAELSLIKIDNISITFLFSPGIRRPAKFR